MSGLTTEELFSNEADAVFTKRIENVEQSVDQMNNAIQNIILEEMESIEGILIATTNLLSNLDPAFERRFIFKVEFKMPEKDSRAKIWKSMIPTLSEEDVSVLADKYAFSGGNIENIARKSTVEYVLSGNEPTLSSLEGYCQEEILDKKENRNRIGFYAKEFLSQPVYNTTMANINVNTTELIQLLDMTPADHNLMLVGKHGIGKSEILTDYFSKKGMPVVALFLGQMSDPGDLIGIPNKNEETGKTDFMPPYWFPLDGKPIVLFLDELNRARPEILQTIMDLALNRKLAGRKLPDGSRIISAVNAGDQYQLTDLDPALVSRFNIVNFRPTVQEWLLWARKADVDGRVIDFIQENQIWLDKDPDAKEGEDTGLDKAPDRRGWKRVSDILKQSGEISPLLTKVISAVVGPKAASAFVSNVSSRKIVSGREVMLNFPKVKEKLDKYELHQFSVVNDGIYRFLEVEKVPAKDKEIAKKNLEDYFEYLTRTKKEAAAHFANLFVQKTYPNAVAFIARECQVLTMMFISYVKGIK